MIKRKSALLLALLVSAFVLQSCSHGLSIQEAANSGKAKCGKNQYIK